MPDFARHDQNLVADKYSYMYKYRGFGLHISSGIEFPELCKADFEQADVTISIGKVPTTITGSEAVKKAFALISPDEYLLHVRKICSYYAAHGNTIIAEPAPGIDEHSIRLFLLDTVMAAIIYQRGAIPMQASGVIRDNKLVLFTGNAGMGKSAIAGLLATKGYNLFTDDICTLHLHDGKILCTASYPMLKLWEDAIQNIDNERYDMDYPVRPKLPKFGHFFHDAFVHTPMQLDKIFIISSKNTATKISAAQLPKIHAFKQLEHYAYKYELMPVTKFRSTYFAALSQLANTVPVFDVQRPTAGTKIDAVLQTIENLL